MIKIDKEKCTGCGLCARICHEQCITLSALNGNKVEKIDHSICSTCIQCIGVCPKQALSWNQIPSVPYNRKHLPSGEQLVELLKQRRTTRYFKDKKIDRDLLAEIIGMGIYAPTNNYDLRAIVVDDPRTMEELDNIIMGFVAWLYRICYQSNLAFKLFSKITPKINAKHQIKLARGLEVGHSYDSLQTTLVFIVGDSRIPLSEASAQYALYNMILYAQTKRIGSRIKAAGSVTLDKSWKARKRLGLRRHEHVLATVELGYPSVKFSNKVQGKRMLISWCGSEQHV